MAWLASAFSSIRARCPKKVRRRDLMGESGWLVGNATDVGHSDRSRVNECPGFFIGTIGPLRQSAVVLYPDTGRQHMYRACIASRGKNH